MCPNKISDRQELHYRSKKMYLTSYNNKQQCNRQQMTKSRCPGSENSFSKWISYKGAGNKNVAAFFPFLFVTLWLADSNSRIAIQAHPIRGDNSSFLRSPSKSVHDKIYVDNRPPFSTEKMRNNIREEKYNVLGE